VSSSSAVTPGPSTCPGCTDPRPPALPPPPAAPPRHRPHRPHGRDRSPQARTESFVADEISSAGTDFIRACARNGAWGDEPACKPDSVPLRAVIIHLRPPLPAAFPRCSRTGRAAYPEARAGRPRTLPQTPWRPCGLAPGGVCRAAPVTRCAVVSCTAVSPLPEPVPVWGRFPGGLFSVALSRGSPRVGVAHHPALWSPDFPQLAPRSPGRLVQVNDSTPGSAPEATSRRATRARPRSHAS